MTSLEKGFDIIKILGGESLIVGGAVRDYILGHEPHDVDICTNVPIEEIEKHFKVYDIGKSKSFGIVCINYKGEPFEISQFRADGEYKNGRSPEDITIVNSFKEDSARRDLTINALGMDYNKNIIDYHNGINDIHNKIIRMVGDPVERIEEDKLRMLRVARFASKLNFVIDEKTLEACRKFSSSISEISAERNRDELIKSSSSGEVLAQMILNLDEMNLLRHILPEIHEMHKFPHKVEHHPEGNCFYHTVEALRVSKSVDPITNLGILFHDVGKIKTFDKENITYYRHDYVGGKMIEGICERLKFSNKEKEAFKFIAVNHMKFHNILKMRNSKIRKLMDDENFQRLYDTSEADNRARLHLFKEEDWQKVRDKLNEVENAISQKDCQKIKKSINGKVIMELLNIKPSKFIGEIIKDVYTYAVDNNIKDDKVLLEYIKEKYKKDL